MSKYFVATKYNVGVYIVFVSTRKQQRLNIDRKFLVRRIHYQSSFFCIESLNKKSNYQLSSVKTLKNKMF